MRAARPAPPALALLVLLAAGCGGGGDDGGGDAASEIDAPAASPDAAPGPDAPAARPEVEPNDGDAIDEVDPVTVPAVVTGAIGVADDADVYRLEATAGDRLVATVQGSGTLQPHLAVFGDAALEVPPAVSTGAASAMAEAYVLASGTYYVAVRDRRNVGGSSAHVGGAGFTYTLAITPLARPAEPVAAGADAPVTLDPPGTIAVFALEAQAGQALSITVLAARRSPPSDVDPRLSLFHPGQGAWLGTNDDLALDQRDSLLEGPMPFDGIYHVIVENEGAPAPGDDLTAVLRVTAP